MAGKKYYAVKKGLKPGIYSNWAECKKQVSGFSGAVYKSFENYESAQLFLEQNEVLETQNFDNTNTIKAYIDGSFSESEDTYSYGCVFLIDGEIIKTLNGVGKSSDYSEMRNVAGELLGSMMAIKWACKNDYKKIMVYHDYEGISRWANGDWKANKRGTQEYVEFIKKYNKLISIEFVKVKGHSGDKYNDIADKLAKEAITGLLIEDETDSVDPDTNAMELFYKCMSKRTRTKAKFDVTHKMSDVTFTEKNIENFVKEYSKLKGHDLNAVLSTNVDIDYGLGSIEWKHSMIDGSEIKYIVKIK